MGRSRCFLGDRAPTARSERRQGSRNLSRPETTGPQRPSWTKVVLAEGLDPSNLHHFGQDHVDVIVAGSHVVESSDPAQAVRSLASMAQTVWRSGS